MYIYIFRFFELSEICVFITFLSLRGCIIPALSWNELYFVRLVSTPVMQKKLCRVQKCEMPRAFLLHSFISKSKMKNFFNRLKGYKKIDPDSKKQVQNTPCITEKSLPLLLTSDLHLVPVIPDAKTRRKRNACKTSELLLPLSVSKEYIWDAEDLANIYLASQINRLFNFLSLECLCRVINLVLSRVDDMSIDLNSTTKRLVLVSEKDMENTRGFDPIFGVALDDILIYGCLVKERKLKIRFYSLGQFMSLVVKRQQEDGKRAMQHYSRTPPYGSLDLTPQSTIKSDETDETCSFVDSGYTPSRSIAQSYTYPESDTVSDSSESVCMTSENFAIGYDADETFANDSDSGDSGSGIMTLGVIHDRIQYRSKPIVIETSENPSSQDSNLISL